MLLLVPVILSSWRISSILIWSVCSTSLPRILYCWNLSKVTFLLLGVLLCS